MKFLAVGLWMAVLLMSNGTALASPGAHGPNGEHLDAPAQAVVVDGRGAPRLEAKSETFELVAVLRADELSILISRFETGEPVLDARVEVESGDLKAAARFHPDLGDYAVDDAKFLQALRVPGEHALVMTVLANDATDLLDGTLRTPAAAADHAPASHDHGRGLLFNAWLAGSVLAVLGLIFWLRSRASRKSPGVAP